MYMSIVHRLLRIANRIDGQDVDAAAAAPKGTQPNQPMYVLG